MKRVRIDVFLAIAIAAVGVVAWFAIRKAPERTAERQGEKLFEDLLSRRDHVRLIVSGRLMAEIVTCGCKRGHYGGITRLSTAIREERASMPSVVAIDAGDSLVSPDSRRRAANDAQTLKKAEVMADFFKSVKPEVAALGELDLLIGAAPAGALLNDRGFVPVVTNAEFPDGNLKTVTYAAWERSGWRFVLCNLFSAKAFGDVLHAKALDPLSALDEALKAAGPADILVVCCHQFDEALLRALATRPGPPRLLIDVEGAGRFENPEEPAPSWILRPPAKGESLLAVDLYLRRGASGWLDAAKLRDPYQRRDAMDSRVKVAESCNLVELKSRLMDKSVNEDAGTQELVGNYRKWIGTSGVAEPPADPGAPRYLGAVACGQCHKAQFENWKTTLHAKAWESLEKDPGGGAEDPECASCHVSGFQTPGGPYKLADAFLFRGVQCESCHAPLAIHPGPAKHAAVSEAVCRSCHTETRDPDFRFDADLPLATCTKAHDPAARRPPR